MVDIPRKFKGVKCWVYFILAFTHSVKAQETSSTTEVSVASFPTTVAEIILNDAKNYTWKSIDFPQPYPPQTEELIIKASSGYSVLITIETLDLDSDYGDFLVIKPGTTLEGEEAGKVFIYKLKSTRNYLVHSSTVYLSLQIKGGNEGRKKGFLLYYQRVGEEFVSTTANPTTAVTWPTPSGSESAYHTVFVSGKSQEDFNDQQTLFTFKTALAAMATEYCDTNIISLTEKITEQNVLIYYLIQCPYAWPESNTCVKVRFALPVLLAENSAWSGYQLNTAHLEEMWIRLASKYLAQYNMDVYSEPDNKSSMQMWIVISIVTLILFLILLGLIKMFGQQVSPLKNQKRRSSDAGFMSTQSRVSKVSLAPHPYQTTPSFFENDYAYDQWEPNVGIPEKAYNSAGNDYSFPLGEDDSDNEIIFENLTNFSNSRNNIGQQVNTESNS